MLTICYYLFLFPKNADNFQKKVVYVCVVLLLEPVKDFGNLGLVYWNTRSRYIWEEPGNFGELPTYVEKMTELIADSDTDIVSPELRTRNMKLKTDL